MKSKASCALSLLCLTVSTASVCIAQDKTIYEVVNDDGTITYTDVHPNSSAVSVFEASSNTANQSAPLSTPQVSSAPIQSTERQYSPLEIAYPAPEATIRNNQGDISIRVKPVESVSNPSYGLLFDGNMVQKNTTGIFTLSGIDRGTHTYLVILMDNKGKTLASSPEQTLFLHKASVLINNN